MMNLSINLTLGSPGADSVLNTAPADAEAADSFSQTLAEELSGQELTASLRLEDSQTAETVIADQIATWQQLAADDTTVIGKDGQIWLDDPIADIPEAAVADSAADALPSDEKPWFDIIEKAKNYSPVMQANKPSADTVTEVVEAAASPQQTSDSNTAALSLADAGNLSAETLAAPEPESISSVLDLKPAELSEAAPVLQAVEASVSAATATATDASSGGTNSVVVQQKPAAEATAVQPATASVAQDEGLVDEPVVAVDSSRALAKQVQQLTTPLDKLTTEQAGAESVEINAAQEVVQAGTTTETAATVPHAKPPHAEQKATQSQNSVLSDATVAAQSPATDPVQQATMVTDTLAATTNRPVQTGGTDKAPAANAFAEHLKSVNQNQLQQQQQSGAEQQPGQGQAQAQAKTNTETLAANVATPQPMTTPQFAQQLQQASEIQSPAVPATQSHGHISAASSTAATLLSGRPVDSTPWQAPLTLADPSAAQQLKDRVMVQIQQKLQTAEVQLHPEDLGTMQIKLNLQQDQLSVQFIVQQGAAKEALEQQMPRLRDMLEQQGIALSEGQVEQRQSGTQQEQRQTRSGHSDSSDADVAVKQQVQIRVSDRMVDFYA